MSNPTSPDTSERAGRKEIASWCMFDFANSSFTTIVVTVVFANYFAGVIAAGDGDDFVVRTMTKWFPDLAGKDDRGNHLWNFCQLVTNIAIFLTAPVIGAIADRGRGKKGFLFLSYIACVGASALLFFAGPGDVAFAMGLFIFAYVAFSCGENLLAGFLPDLATSEDMGRISSIGWATGYAGALISLGISLPLALSKSDVGIRATNLVVAGFFFLGGLPMFLFVRERGQRHKAPLLASVRAGIAQVFQTWRDRRAYRQFSRFLGAYVVFNIGIYGVIAFAGRYAMELYGFTQAGVIGIFIATQVTAGAGALIAGKLCRRFGCKRTIEFSLFLWLLAAVLVYFVHDRRAFFVIAVLAGMAMGSSLPAGRAVIGRFAPEGRSGEFFGLWGQFARLAAILGAFGHQFVLAMRNELRDGIVFFGVTFIAGWLLLRRVDEDEGVREAANGNGSNPR